MMKPSTASLHDRAVSQLGICNRIEVEGQTHTIVCLVREKDIRPLPKGFRHGKQASLLAVDIDGNFFVRDANGCVTMKPKNDESEQQVASSLREFLLALKLGE